MLDDVAPRQHPLEKEVQGILRIRCGRIGSIFSLTHQDTSVDDGHEDAKDGCNGGGIRQERGQQFPWSVTHASQMNCPELL